MPKFRWIFYVILSKSVATLDMSAITQHDPDAHRSLGDIAFDSHSVPSVVRLRIKQSKIDPFRQGVDVYVGAISACICPVEALLVYIAIREADPGPLFIFQSGAPLTRSSLVQHLRQHWRKRDFPIHHIQGTVSA